MQNATLYNMTISTSVVFNRLTDYVHSNHKKLSSIEAGEATTAAGSETEIAIVCELSAPEMFVYIFVRSVEVAIFLLPIASFCPEPESLIKARVCPVQNALNASVDS